MTTTQAREGDAEADLKVATDKGTTSIVSPSEHLRFINYDKTELIAVILRLEHLFREYIWREHSTEAQAGSDVLKRLREKVRVEGQRFAGELPNWDHESLARLGAYSQGYMEALKWILGEMWK